MGSVGDDDDETQPCDAQLSPLPSDNIKGEDFDHLLQSKWPLKETVPAEDELETQLMNFEGETQVIFNEGLETQVMNFEGETQDPFEDGLDTQVMNFADETQVLDDFNGFNMNTQQLDVWNNDETDKADAEESDNTDVLCDTDVLYDNNSVKEFVCSSADSKNAKQDEKENKSELDVFLYEKTSAGGKMNFTSVHAAALRASGLAARNKAPNKSNSNLCSSKNENESCKEDLASEDNNATGIRGSLVHAVEIDGVLDEEQMEGIRDESHGRVGISAVRRLFMDDDELDENGVLDDNYLSNVDGVLENEIAGLSYVDSQEPGDLSQAIALDFVDKFLKSNGTDFDKGVGIVVSTEKKSEAVSIIKGTQSLAKKSGLKSISGEKGIYDWDDNHEDEGGGEFFSRQKKLFFDDEENDLSCSASKVHTSKRTVKRAKVAEIKKNLTKELDEQLNVGSLDGVKVTSSEKDLQDMFNVGPDTQMAAEAIEELCLGLEVIDKDTDRIAETTGTVEKEDKKLPAKYSLRKRLNTSNCEDLTRKSKQRRKSGTNMSYKLTVSSSKHTKNVGEKYKDLDKSVISPSSGRKQVHTCTPVASRTRQHSGTRQLIVENITCDTSIGKLSYKKGRRSHRKLSDDRHGSVNLISGLETKEKPHEISSGAKANPPSFSVDVGFKRKTHSSLCAITAFPSSDRECETSLCNRNGVKEKFEEGILKCKLRDGSKGQTDFSRGNLSLDVSPGERSKLSVSTSTTPASCSSSAAAASPICKGDEYLKQSCRKNLSVSFLVKEIGSLISDGPEPSPTMKDSRRRRDMANVRVLFSHHLDDDIIKHQTKILTRLGASVAPSIREATHFVTNKFVRTRNMLEAIAFGKPVVTHLWLESCGQANCCIDERNYILRDAKKEKEFGFSLPASLAQSCQRPLLQGLKVWITPSTKPGVEILSSLVKAVHGLPVERIGRSVLSDEKIPNDLLALSCEEDYAACLYFLEKGGNAFSSELLLNGIVTQKIEFERHRLFDDRVKKTRYTRMLKRDNNQYLPVSKCK